MTCDLIFDWIDDYLDNQLDAHNRAQFEQHLETCNECKMLVEDFVSMREVMSEMPLLAVPNGFNESLHEKLLIAAEEIKAENKSNHKVLAFPVKMKQTFRYVGAAAAIVLVVASGLQLKDQFWWQQPVGEEASFQLKNAGGPAEVPPMSMDTSTSDTVMPEAANVTADAGANGGAATDANLMKAAPTPSPQAPAPVVQSTAPAAEAGRQLIHSGDVTLEVGNYDVFYQKIEKMTAEAGGYVESSYSGKSPFYENNKLVGSQLSGSLVLRIPSVQFKAMFDQVKTLGVLQSSQQNVQDVTTQITDMNANIQNLKVRETRLRELMQQAKNVMEVMAVETELSNVRTQIDSIEAQLKQQMNQVSLSTLYVNVQEKPEIGGQFQKIDGNLFERAKQALIGNINRGVILLEVLLIALVAWSPVILVLIILTFIGTKTTYYKKWRQKK